MSPAAPAAAAPKVDLTDLGDPTKTPSQSMSFSEFLSAINPLQHIPVVGTIYRAITGDIPPPAARVVGGLLLGGPLGLVASAADAILEQASGKDLGGHAMAMLGLDHDSSPTPAAGPQYAAQTSPAADAAPGTDSATASGSATPPVPAAVAAAPAPAAEPTPPAATSPSSAPQTAAAPGGIAPVSRALLGHTPPPLSPMAAMGGPASPFSNGIKQPAGWTLADYQANAGHPMPQNASTNGTVRNTPVPLQTTVPLAGDVAHMALTPLVAPTAAAPASNQAPAPSTPAAATDPSESWVAQAMMRNLDRYRDMMKQQNQGQRTNSQLDGSF